MVRFSRALVAFVFGLFFLAGGLQASEFRAGEHYEVLEQPLPEGVAPVTEFFYYGCRACYQLADAIAAWSQENDIPVGLVPAHTENNLVDAARLYHTLAVVGRLDLYKAGFVLFQTEKSDLQGEDRINAFLAEQGVDQNLFWQSWKGEEVSRRLAGSYMLTRTAGILNTPSFVVHGRYKVDTSVIHSVEELFALLQYLVDLGAAEGA